MADNMIVDYSLLAPPKKVGERWEYLNMTFWPEGGVIHIEDHADEDFTTVFLTDWVDRILGMRAEVEKLRMQIDTTFGIQRQTMQHEWECRQSLVEAMIDCGQRAKKQGDPHDDKVAEYNRRHRTYKKSTIAVPGAVESGSAKKLILPY